MTGGASTGQTGGQGSLSAPRVWLAFFALLGRVAVALVVRKCGRRGRCWALVQFDAFLRFGNRLDV